MSATLGKIGDVTGGRISWLIAMFLLVVMFGEPAQRAVLITYHKAFPIIVEWKPSAVFVDGADVIVSGSMRKAYDCEYVPPPRAFDHSGRPFIVVSMSSTPIANYPTGYRPFGPWRIIGGAGAAKIDIAQEHDCGNGVIVFSHLGTLNRPHTMGVK